MQKSAVFIEHPFNEGLVTISQIRQSFPEDSLPDESQTSFPNVTFSVGSVSQVETISL